MEQTVACEATRFPGAKRSHAELPPDNEGRVHSGPTMRPARRHLKTTAASGLAAAARGLLSHRSVASSRRAGRGAAGIAGGLRLRVTAAV